MHNTFVYKIGIFIIRLTNILFPLTTAQTMWAGGIKKRNDWNYALVIEFLRSYFHYLTQNIIMKVIIIIIALMIIITLLKLFAIFLSAINLYTVTLCRSLCLKALLKEKNKNKTKNRFIYFFYFVLQTFRCCLQLTRFVLLKFLQHILRV